MKVAIIGYGWVGKAMHKLFPDAVLYDPYVGGDSGKAFNSKEETNECDIAFICVPTPNVGEGKLDTSIVEEVISWCKCPLIVIRSTVNPGDCDRWTEEILWARDNGQEIVMQPEYLGETPNHPLLDPKTRQFLIIGGKSKDRRKLIDLYTSVYNANISIRQVTALEAEIIKLCENRAIAIKVAECQELYDVLEKVGVDYYTIREAVYNDDPRFNLWWSFIFPDKRGLNSKCLPKDVYAWCAWAESLGYSPKITKAILDKNKEWVNG